MRWERNFEKPAVKIRKPNTFFCPSKKVDVSNLTCAILQHLWLLLGRNFPETEKTLQTSTSKNERKVD